MSKRSIRMKRHNLDAAYNPHWIVDGIPGFELTTVSPADDNIGVQPSKAAWERINAALAKTTWNVETTK